MKDSPKEEEDRVMSSMARLVKKTKILKKLVKKNVLTKVQIIEIANEFDPTTDTLEINLEEYSKTYKCVTMKRISPVLALK